jgi:nucleotide-binding universal stress UspA family protein
MSPVSHEVVHGHPGRTLVGLSVRADLLVAGRHAKHPGLPGAGAVRHAVLNHAHSPVVTVPSA